MNALDALLILMIVIAVVGGYRLGFLARATSWIGLVIGLLGASYFLPDIVDALQDYEPSNRFLIASGIFLGCAFLGQAIGLVLGANLHHALPPGRLRTMDRGAGAAAGMAGVLITIWLLAPSMVDVPGWPARQARASRVAEAVNELFPDPPDALGALRRLVGDDSFPRVFGPFQAAPDAGPAPADAGLTPAVVSQVMDSTVRVEGFACRRQQDGTGFVVAPEIVVTNAHVVAGESATEVIVAGGRRLDAAVVVFDTDRDLAVLAVPELGLPPLSLGEGEVGSTGAVFGHPGGQEDVEVSPAVIRQRVEAVGRDLYDSRATRREVFVLAADLRPGDSGGGLVDSSGRVVGVAFAVAPDRPGTAYALTRTELDAALAEPRDRVVDTGPCLSA
jgi:S1-C subfamily serine protease